MIRILALAVMLSPGIAYAQKFVSVGDDGETTAIAAENETPEDDTTSVADAYGDSLVFDGATVEEIEALLANAAANGQAADAEHTLVGRVSTDENGDAVLTLDTSGSLASSEAPGVDTLELGECNEGTNWVSNETNCYNAYPTEF
ncbi:hypothetical protein [Jannaschia donghaensis]|uniref:Pilin n=1 Tax=Jannaschia donghaensis TaxID=420998 RepID=A0A0M6YJ74_9RHOB|nr:hypothetical protein [Jannaschia donghaensis]CTQ50408.1 hypothetical protein JDO7802_02432 [Jannaschia donghaensis]